MSVILVDLASDQHHLQINWWNWRPILAILRQADLIDDEQFERMGANGCGGQLTEGQAIKASTFLKQEVLPRLKDGERIHTDGQISTAPSEPRPIASTSPYELYAAKKACLESFAAFCLESKGFTVM